jgi:hypothetical protein
MVSTGSVEMSQAPNVPKPWRKNIIESENIWAETSNGEGNVEIVFMGHYDSKSTRLTGAQRVVGYMILLLCALIILIIGLIGIVAYFAFPQIIPTLQTILWVAAIVAAIFGGIITLNVVGNKSPGVSDNGTAIVILLEAMEYFKKNPIKGANITYLFSAAEEIGLTGAYYFVKNRFQTARWNPDNVYVINYDLAGMKGKMIMNDAIGIPKKQCSPIMSKIVDEILSVQGIELKKAYLPIGGWTDALPFIEKGYKTASFAGMSTKIHSNEDDFSMIDEKNLYKSLVIGVELAKKIAQKK